MHNAKDNCEKKNGPTKSWRRGSGERRDYHLSQGVWPFMAKWLFLILTSSYYHLLLITPGDILNEIGLLYCSSSEVKTCHGKYIFVQCSFSNTANWRSFIKRTAKEASWRLLLCRCKSKKYCKNFKCRVSTENLHYVADYLTAVIHACLLTAVESFRWMFGFKWKSGSIFQIDGRKAKLSQFTFTQLILDNAIEWHNH